MKHHLNTLYVTTPGAHLARSGKVVIVRVGGEIKLRVPIHALGSVVCFGAIGLSPALMGLCAASGVSVTLCSRGGSHVATVSGSGRGNVVMRRAHYRVADDDRFALEVARSCVAAKLANCRTLLLRAAREARGGRADALEQATREVERSARAAWQSTDLDVLRGLEGEGARAYFSAFNAMIVAQGDDFKYVGRSRRPPRDAVNSLLSFLYAMLANDARAACEAAGLDAFVGFLHRERPGRPGLALDLMEEFRPVIADRVVLTLINRQQVRAAGFERQENGAVLMSDETRRVVLTVYQERKQEVIAHPILEEKTTIGLLPFLQARLLARHIRGELDAYPAFLWR